MKNGVVFNHFRPAAHFARHIDVWGPKLDKPTLNRFEETKSVIKQAGEQKFDDLAMHYTLHDVAFIERDTQAMQREMDWIIKNDYPTSFTR